MTIIVFLVDTSCSMNQRTYAGTTFLDTAKNAVEMFMKIRSRDPNCRWDRYMLLTFEEPPMNVKAGWKESHATFMKELKNLEAHCLTTLGPALKHTFDMLNTNRMQSGIDTYGQGRCPFFLEPAVIICLTDGKKMTSLTGASNELNLPMNVACLPGSELTKEPFRWDQRLYGIVFKMSATPIQDNLTYIPSDDSSIDAMCEVTGGRSYAVATQKMLMQCLESLVQKCQSGVVVNFEKLPSEPHSNNNNNNNNNDSNNNNGGSGKSQNSPQNQPWHNCKRLIYVPRSAQRGGTVGHWPIPEAYWPDASRDVLPPRTAHPIINFSCQPCEPITLENLPFDKYEMEPSPLTQYILERRQPHVVWQVYMQNSCNKYSTSDIGYPFGYIKASTTLNAVNLFVMPYNYAVLVPLLDELIKVLKYKPTIKWKMQFDAYLKTVPAYYANPLKRAFSRMSLPPTLNLIPDQMDNCLSYSVVLHLKKIKNQAKLEYDRLVASVGQYPTHCPTIRVLPSRPPTPRLASSLSSSTSSSAQRGDFKHLIIQYSAGNACGPKQGLLSSHNNMNNNNNNNMNNNNLGVDSFEVFNLHAIQKIVDTHIYTNPYDIHRSDLLLNLAKMRMNLLKSHNHALSTKFQNMDAIHNSPIQEMGNYQDYLKRQQPPLREIETTPTRVHTFGNPFKVKNMMIDEADEAMPGQSSSSSSSSSARKRSLSESSTSSSTSSSSSLSKANKKRGPIPRSYTLRTFLSSLSSSPPPPPSSPSLPSSLTPCPPTPIPSSDPVKSGSDDANRSNDVTMTSDENEPCIDLKVGSSEQTSLAGQSSDHSKLRKKNKNKNINNNKNKNNSNNNNNSMTTNNKNDLSIINNNVENIKMTNGIDVLVSQNHINNNSSNIADDISLDNSSNDAINNGVTDDDDFEVASSVLELLNSKKSILNGNVDTASFNSEIKKLIVTEVKKPGKKYTIIFNLLRCLRGDTSEKRSQIEKVISEASRFKKYALVRILEEYCNNNNRNNYSNSIRNNFL
ncbi:hypothetical protein HELRODRAFT_96652 [Helobdella robusta]|uniref:VWFA domain-containing protein n=1 Tax=Helobdella robusta TaxID=6412 RepID=T1G9D0_HELRO|nr:hypothetical protein HELRODRAFT_96652 [Helobdella robusta]ESN90694.1 hypothetical protein HELRODRAFT_96652 [Helobdella robusta]